MMRTILVAAALALAPPAAAQQSGTQPAFDLRTFDKATVANSTAVRFTCNRPQVCGERATVTLRLQTVQTEPTLQTVQARIDRLAQAARQNTQSFSRVETTPATEATVSGLKHFRAEARLTRTNNAVAYNVDGVLVRGTTIVTIVAASGDQAVARRNYEGFLPVAAVVLEQHLAATAPRPATAPGTTEAPATLGD